jgi:hypothetical protein
LGLHPFFLAQPLTPPCSPSWAGPSTAAGPTPLHPPLVPRPRAAAAQALLVGRTQPLTLRAPLVRPIPNLLPASHGMRSPLLIRPLRAPTRPPRMAAAYKGPRLHPAPLLRALGQRCRHPEAQPRCAAAIVAGPRSPPPSNSSAAASQTTRTTPGAPHGGELHVGLSPTFSLDLSRVRALAGVVRPPLSRPATRTRLPGHSRSPQTRASASPRPALRACALSIAPHAPLRRRSELAKAGHGAPPWPGASPPHEPPLARPRSTVDPWSTAPRAVHSPPWTRPLPSRRVASRAGHPTVPWLFCKKALGLCSI